ncbi:hypothetical protein OLMES_5007 [Oleiphilus messinensis]|uniref:Uncharacterized protein n=1 Tax=Oleiphilus messinensis TaxID=141451 RepID=A0A1Y0IHX6_9GAMM|nr:hypothetical protein [Oleiphilus messinensis]ARU58994.1 hypothetical protein OLMES_5007 [Oleiphilus messinensis]
MFQRELNAVNTQPYLPSQEQRSVRTQLNRLEEQLAHTNMLYNAHKSLGVNIGYETTIPLEDHIAKIDILLETIEDATIPKNTWNSLLSRWAFVKGAYLSYSDTDATFAVDFYSAQMVSLIEELRRH